MTIVILLVAAAWLILCMLVVALARTAARGDQRRARTDERRFLRSVVDRPSSRNPD